MSVKTRRDRDRARTSETGGDNRTINWFSVSLYILMFVLLAAFSGLVIFLIM